MTMVINNSKILASVVRPLRINGSKLIVLTTRHVTAIKIKCEIMLINAFCPIESTIIYAPLRNTICLISVPTIQAFIKSIVTLPSIWGNVNGL